MKRTLFTKQPLEQLNPPVKKLNAAYPAYRNEDCEHRHVYYAGKIPCTGPLRCSMCNTTWDSTTGKLIKRGDAHLISANQNK